MSKNAASVHEPATSMRSVRSAWQAAVRQWLGKPGGGVRGWIKLAVAAAVVAIVVSFVDWRESLRLLGNVWLVPVLLALLLLTAGLALSTLKWQALLAVHAIRVPLLRLLRYYWIGAFYSSFLPSNVGGDVAASSSCMTRGIRPS